MLPDAKLVKRALAGREGAYAELVRRWTGRVLALCHSLTRHRQTAEDLTQESFVRGYVALASLRDPESFGPWLRGIARRACFDWLRTQKRPMVLFSQLGEDWRAESELAGEQAEVSAMEEEEEKSRLLEEVDKLPEDYRIVLMLYYYGNHTYADLAALLEVSSATINLRLTKGRAMLRRRLESIQKSS